MPDQVRALVARAIDLMGGLDLLLNNAGIAVSKDFLDLTDEDFDRTVDVNLKAAFVGSQAAARHMLATGTRGTITSMSSVNAVLNIPNLLTYNITKGGVHVHDFHATMLNQLGINHDAFTFKFQGLSAKLSGVEGAKVIKDSKIQPE